MNWFNPMNWVKAGVASAADTQIDKYITPEKAKDLAREGVNYVVKMSESKVEDEKIAKIAEGITTAGAALYALGGAIHPQSEEGRKISPEELDTILEKLDGSLGNLLDDDTFKGWREKIKNLVRVKLGIA